MRKIIKPQYREKKKCQHRKKTKEKCQKTTRHNRGGGMQELTAVAMLVLVVGGGRGLRKICNLCGRVCSAGYIIVGNTMGAHVWVLLKVCYART